MKKWHLYFIPIIGIIFIQDFAKQLDTYASKGKLPMSLFFALMCSPIHGVALGFLVVFFGSLMKPLYKLNSGIGATICNHCSKIIDTKFIDVLFCNDCKVIENTLEELDEPCILIVREFPKENLTPIGFFGDYTNITIYVNNERVIVYGDEYHAKGAGRTEGFIDCFTHLHPSAEVRKLDLGRD